MRNSTPHTVQRYRTLIRRMTPVGGGGGGAVDAPRNIANPHFQVNQKMATPPRIHRMRPSMILRQIPGDGLR